MPPGLWLPTAEESTDQYLTENFASRELEPEDIIDYGAFIVALAFYNQENTGRISMMPDSNDFHQMYTAGYGIPLHTLQRKHCRLNALRRVLGFYPRDYMPSANETIQRFQWVADYAYPLDPLSAEEVGIDEIMAWGSARNLTPSREKVYIILNGNTTVLRKMFQVERRDHHRQYSYLDLYRFGARVIEENDGPVNIDILNSRYAGVFAGSPRQTIRAVFGTMNRFWQEFDYRPPTARGLTKQDVVNLGVRRAIQQGRVNISIRAVEDLSHQMKSPSLEIVNNYFGGTGAYSARVAADYHRYQQLLAEFGHVGVEPPLFKAICRTFEATSKYETRLRENVGVLLKLSAASSKAAFVCGVLQKGFNLLDDAIMDMQFEDFTACLSDLDITAEAELRFVFDNVPRFNTDEALARIRVPKAAWS